MELDYIFALVVALIAGVAIGNVLTKIDNDYEKTVPLREHKYELMNVLNILENVCYIAENAAKDEDIAYCQQIWIDAANEEIKRLHKKYGGANV